MTKLPFISLLIGCFLFIQCKNEKQTSKGEGEIVNTKFENDDLQRNDVIIDKSDKDTLEVVDTSKIKPIEDQQQELINDAAKVQLLDTSKSNNGKIVEVKPSPEPVYVDPKPKPKKFDGSIDSILFESLVYNFDTITAGEIIKHNFNFINKNINPIEVTSTYPDCGCTTPSFPFLPLENMDKGFIGVTYNSVGKSGQQNATVQVKFLNIKDEIGLTMSGFVKNKPKEMQLESEEK